MTHICRCFREPQIISVEEWSAVLRLSTEWSFQGIRELAMKRLEPIATPIEKIVLSHSYAIPGWLPEAYTSLCERPHSLIASEIKVVQPEDVELVMSIRETIFRSGRSWERSEIVSRIVEVMRSTSEASAPADESTVSVQQERTPESLKEGAGLAGAADTTAEATNEQELPSDVTLRLDASSFLTLVSANNARDLDYIATQIPRMVKKEVTALLNDLTLDNVASIAGQITRWANLAKDDDDCATLVRVVELVYIKATSNWAYARPCALLCRKITDGISSEIRCDKVRDINGGLIRGGLLFRKYLHDRCQANFKSVCLEGSTGAGPCYRWLLLAVEQLSLQCSHFSLLVADLPRETAVGDLSTMHEHECAVVRFIGELAAAHVLGHAIALDSIERLPPDPEGTTPNEQKVRLVCALLLTAGQRINQAFSFKGRARMNRYLDFINSVDTSKVEAQTAAMIEVCRPRCQSE